MPVQIFLSQWWTKHCANTIVQYPLTQSPFIPTLRPCRATLRLKPTLQRFYGTCPLERIRVGALQIHPASFRYDFSANSDTPKLRKPAGITAAVKPSSCFSSTFRRTPLATHTVGTTLLLFSSTPSQPRPLTLSGRFLHGFNALSSYQGPRHTVMSAISRAHQTLRNRPMFLLFQPFLLVFSRPCFFARLRCLACGLKRLMLMGDALWRDFLFITESWWYSFFFMGLCFKGENSFV